MSDSLSITGTIIEIFPEQQFDSGFSKREFVVQTGDRYPQPIKFELLKERCSQLDSYQEGDRVVVHFNLRGSLYQERYYVNLIAWRIQADGESPASAASRYGDRSPHPPVTAGMGFDAGDDDDIPF